MAKKLIAIPEGSLMRLAASKGRNTFSALKEKTGVDRKTLRAINSGQPVKEMTLQKIADKLRVPLEHLFGSHPADEIKNISGGGQAKFFDVKLQQLDATGLRKVFEDTEEINWILQVSQMPTDLELLLLKLEKALKGWFHQFNGVGEAGTGLFYDFFSKQKDTNLAGQIEFIRASADIDQCVAELAERNLKICGGTYVFWQRWQPPDFDMVSNVSLSCGPLLCYMSKVRAALSVVPKEKVNPTVQVWTGEPPPQQFSEIELDRSINRVLVDDTEVWARRGRF